MVACRILPEPSSLVDRQYFQVPVADGQLIGFQYDEQTNTLYQRESQVAIPSMHGSTHISEDPVPDATCDSPGLMSADDKCKLDAAIQTRVGVLGYQGAGMADDGGYLVGDIILAAGSEFISLERVGNTVRFTVDSPLPLSCNCEDCARIFWIQDESETRSVRPPSCNGIMPDVSAYGELKIYTYPESTIFDPTNPDDFFNQKGIVPSLIFKRYDNRVTPYENSFEVVLKRNQNLTSQTGWSFTPGTAGVAECVWFVGQDKNGAQLKYEFHPETEPGLLGSILANGHLITKQMAVVVDVDPNVLSNNQYKLKLWDVQDAVPVGNEFSATNVWRYLNPENATTDLANPKTLVLDSTVSILPLGTLVDIWQFEITRDANQRTVRTYFSKEPQLNPESLWALSGMVQFGDLYEARDEINSDTEGNLSAAEVDVPDFRLVEREGEWGLTNFEDRLLLSDDGGEVQDVDGVIRREPSGEPINNDIVADSDPSIPGLRIIRQEPSLAGDLNGDGVVDNEDLKIFLCAYGSTILDSNYNPAADFNKDGRVDIRDMSILGQQFDLVAENVADRPVFLWHRQNHKNALVRLKIGQPRETEFTYPPYDLLLNAPVDSFNDTYLKVLQRGVYTTGPFAGAPYVVVKGRIWNQLPPRGTLRILTGAFRNILWKYDFKLAFSNWDDDCAVLINGGDDVFPFDEDYEIVRPTDCTVDHSSQDQTGGTCCPTYDATGGTDVTGITDLEAVEVPTNTTVVELLRKDFTCPAVRFQFTQNTSSGSEQVQLKVQVGILDMNTRYDLNDEDSEDDLVRGFQPGSAVSQVFSQNGFIVDGVGSGVSSSPEAFRCYFGGELPAPINGEVEKWNDVTVLVRDNQVWIWFNGLLVSPDTLLSADQTSPVAVNTPYFPINIQTLSGKMGLRMFPGAVIRSMEVRDQLQSYNEYSLRQMEIVS